MRFLMLVSALVFLLGSRPGMAEEMPEHHDTKPNLTLLVDEELLLPVSQLARHYASHSATPITVLPKDGPMAANQIGQGLEAHVLITANSELLDNLTSQGLTDVSSNHAVARTQLALVGPENLQRQGLFARHISFAAILVATPELPIYITGADHVEGNRAAKLMEGFEFSDALKARAVIVPDRAAQLAAMRAKPGLALMLAADAIGVPDMAIISLLPSELSVPVDYRAVVLASESMQDSRLLNSFLSSPEALEILNHFGFQAPPAK
ncbi:MAG: molybdate ABC transporter substrate-binding protein [Rickettsiales bacterium]